MRILVIGGSSFVGRQIVARALERDHDVTLFNRGQTDPGAFPSATQLKGDRDKDLSALDNGEWDATVDVCAYVPRQVRSLLDTLGNRGGHYTFISTISVYDAEQVSDGYTEDAPLLEPGFDDVLDMARYGPLKVGCEQVAHELVGDRLLVIRPGYVIGPYDPTHRFTYWVERVAAGGPMLGGEKEQPLQAIDGRDLAAFTVGAVERGLRDTLHVTAPDEPPTFDQVIEQIAEGIGTGRPEVRWIGSRDELPFTDTKEFWPMMRADISRAKDHGLWWRPLTETAHDTLAWVRAARSTGGYRAREGYGFASETERGLLNASDL